MPKWRICFGFVFGGRVSELSFIDLHSQISVVEIIEYDIIVINIDIEYWYVIAYCKLIE